jgi:SAM-dependent methyltransferase
MNEVPLPFDDNSADTISAFEVLEHVGRQGDWRFFFRQFEDFWRILKPGGIMFITCPRWDGEWALGDPGHTRVLPPACFAFLHQPMYAQCGKTAMTDYRPWYKGDFDFEVQKGEGHIGVGLRAVKPARIA